MKRDIQWKLRPQVTNAAMNALFSAGGPGAGWPSWQKNPDTSDWQPVLAGSLGYVCAFDGDGTLIGFVNVTSDGRDHAFLLDTRVHPDHRRCGVGRELVARAIEASRGAGCEVLHVDYAPELGRFYDACATKPDGLRQTFNLRAQMPRIELAEWVLREQT